MTQSRIQNGWVDFGEPARGGQKRCPGCGSENFKETLSREICHSCGLECDYWGGGTPVLIPSDGCFGSKKKRTWWNSP